MEAHLAAPDRSLNAGIVGDDSDEFMDFLADDRPDPEEIVIEIKDTETRSRWLNEALETLNPREREIIRHRFLNEDRATLAQIGTLFGVTKERIRQIEGRALSKLRAVFDERHHGETFALIN
jgi:RNA polymerase sigma-32 factor